MCDQKNKDFIKNLHWQYKYYIIEYPDEKKKRIYIENYSKLEVKKGPSVSQNSSIPLHQ